MLCLYVYMLLFIFMDMGIQVQKYVCINSIMNSKALNVLCLSVSMFLFFLCVSRHKCLLVYTHAKMLWTTLKQPKYEILINWQTATCISIIYNFFDILKYHGKMHINHMQMMHSLLSVQSRRYIIQIEGFAHQPVS